MIFYVYKLYQIFSPVTAWKCMGVWGEWKISQLRKGILQPSAEWSHAESLTASLDPKIREGSQRAYAKKTYS